MYQYAKNVEKMFEILMLKLLAYFLNSAVELSRLRGL